MGDGKDDDGGSSSGDDIYKGSAEPVLISLSDSYFDNKILVSDSRYSSCPTYTVTDYFALLTTNLYQFWSKKTILL